MQLTRKAVQLAREENSLEKDIRFEYQGSGTMENMPEDKKLEYEKSKKRVREIFEEAMKRGIAIITAVKIESKERPKSATAFFINGTNPVETIGILTLTIERIKKAISEYAESIMMEDSDNETPKYIG